MQHIAKVTGKSDIEVRKANLASKSTELSELMDTALSWAEYDERRKAVDEYNKVIYVIFIYYYKYKTMHLINNFIS